MSTSLVRIRAIPETIAVGLAGLVGTVLGWSVPSSSGVTPIIGPVPDDFVIAVDIEGHDEPVWIAPEWTENLGDGTGRAAKLDGVPVYWVQRPDGEWEEVPQGTEPGEVKDPSVLQAIWSSIRGPHHE